MKADQRSSTRTFTSMVVHSTSPNVLLDTHFIDPDPGGFCSSLIRIQGEDKTFLFKCEKKIFLTNLFSVTGAGSYTPLSIL